MTDTPANAAAPANSANPGGAPGERDYSQTVFLPRTDFPMRAGLPKKEPEHLKRWADIGVYERLRRESAGRPTYVLHDGPPYANGHIHLGHALNKLLKDFVVRAHQLLGFDSPYVPGWDCHGLPIEWKVEEEFRKKGRAKDDVPVAEFRQRCRDYAADWIVVQREEFKRLGIFGDWDNPYTTMAFEAEAAIVAEFLKFAESGQLFRGSKPVMWSPVEQTALAEAEVDYADHQSSTIWVKFPVRGREASVVIYTTTPWTIPGNRAIAYSAQIAYGAYKVTSVERVVDPKTGEERDPWAKVGETLIVADALWPEVRRMAKIAAADRVADADPAGWVCDHPLNGAHGADGYYDFAVPLLAGDHVTDDTGTGFVHTAPSHGQEDFEVWLAHGLSQADIPDMVDGRGAYYDDVALFAGEQVLRTEGKKAGQEGGANRAVIAKLMESAKLLARGRLLHSYPHSWRSKAPVIYRNTPQWFIRMGEASDPTSLRAKALKALEGVTFTPANARNRITSMVQDRPDWLVSRQRAWGVPLTIFARRDGAIAPGPGFAHNDALRGRILEALVARGADAWFDTPASVFLDGLVDDLDAWEKVEDILDVWFDSGCTHAFTLEARAQLPWPADLYLEGSDQHRGWFQSSLLESCGTRGVAPYRGVLTHGFLLDEEGRKQSKSLGNTIEPADVERQYGAEILRLWVATSDYTQDLRLGPSILQANVDAYRKLRNTLRYLLGALEGFDADERIDLADAPGLERWVLHRMTELDAVVRRAYATHDFKRAFAAIFSFCTNDLSAFYFDVRKDVLYCDRPDSVRRRACRTVMDAAFDRLTAWLAPILVFTAEEAWLTRTGDEDGSVHLRVMPETPAAWADAARAARFDAIRRVRRVINGALEVARRDKRIGSSLDARVAVFVADAAARDAFAVEAAAAGDAVDVYLADIAITSFASLSADPAPRDAFRLDQGERAGEGDDAPVDDIAVVVTRAEGRRCARSRRMFDPASAMPDAPNLTPRDADAVRWWDAHVAPHLDPADTSPPPHAE